MAICVIYNPKVVDHQSLRDIQRKVASQPDSELWPTGSAGDAQIMAAEAVKRRFRRLVVAGGDGMVHEVVNGIAPDFSAIELGVLPFGTGNDLARALGLTPDRWDISLRAAFGDKLRAMDLIRIGGEQTTYCVNVANGGLGGRAGIDVQHIDKQRWGALAYWLTSVSQLTALQTYEVELTLDGRNHRFQSLGLAIANGRFVGGGFPIAPQARLNDGLLDITSVPVLPALELLATGLNFTLGLEVAENIVQTFRARTARLQASPDMPFSIDGEPSRRFDATFDVLPHAVPILVGDHPPGFGDSPSWGVLWS